MEMHTKPPKLFKCKTKILKLIFLLYKDSQVNIKRIIFASITVLVDHAKSFDSLDQKKIIIKGIFNSLKIDYLRNSRMAC